MELELKGKNAIISGSSRGIGLEIAKALHKEGCNVMINGRSELILKKSSQKIGNNVQIIL